MFEIKPKNDNTKQAIAFYTCQRSAYIEMLFWCPQIDQKKQPNFWKDFCPSLLEEVKSKNIPKGIKGPLTPNGMISF